MIQGVVAGPTREEDHKIDCHGVHETVAAEVGDAILDLRSMTMNCCVIGKPQGWETEAIYTLGESGFAYASGAVGYTAEEEAGVETADIGTTVRAENLAVDEKRQMKAKGEEERNRDRGFAMGQVHKSSDERYERVRSSLARAYE